MCVCVCAIDASNNVVILRSVRHGGYLTKDILRGFLSPDLIAESFRY